MTSKAAPQKFGFTWSEHRRIHQWGRLRKKYGFRVQDAEEAGREAHKLCLLRWRSLPSDVRSSVKLPSWRVFANVLGLMEGTRTLANPILQLDLALRQMAEILKYNRQTICAAMRWLGTQCIRYAPRHMQIHERDKEEFCRGIGWLHRARRTGYAYIDGKRTKVYRTSLMVLTSEGLAALKLRVINGARKAKSAFDTLRKRRPRVGLQKMDAIIAHMVETNDTSIGAPHRIKNQNTPTDEPAAEPKHLAFDFVKNL